MKIPTVGVTVRCLILLTFVFSSALFGGLVKAPSSQAQAQGSFLFGAAGDLGHDIGGRRYTSLSLRLINSSGAEFFLALGDLSYNGTGTEQEWCNYVKRIVGAAYPFELVSGNHEDNSGPDGYIGNFARCLPDRLADGLSFEQGYAQRYFFDYPAGSPLARIIMIAAASTIGTTGYRFLRGDQNYQWLSNTIDDARARGIPWVIVGMHHVCITIGTRPCNLSIDLMNLLYSKRVDLVLQGHDHNYQRTKQLTCGRKDAYDQTCIANDGSTGIYPKGQGVVWLINGNGGGDALHPLDTSAPDANYLVSWMGNNTAKPDCGCSLGRGIMKYNVTATTLTGEFVGSTTNFRDEFSIVAGGGSPNSDPSSTAGFGLMSLWNEHWQILTLGLAGIVLLPVLLRASRRRRDEREPVPLERSKAKD